MGKDDNLSIRIDAETKAALKKAAAAEGRTISGYVLWLIYQALNGKQGN